MTSAPMQVQIEEQKTVYEGFFNLKTFKLKHTLYDGSWSEVISRELFQRGDCVAVVLYDPQQDSVVLIEQFRIGALQADNPWLVEIVAGAIEANETAADVAHRESREEAGCEIRSLIKINEFYTTPGTASEKITLFCGLIDSTNIGGIHGLKEEGEDIRVTVVTLDDALDQLNQNKIQSAIAIIGLQWLALNRKQLPSAPTIQRLTK